MAIMNLGDSPPPSWYEPHDLLDADDELDDNAMADPEWLSIRDGLVCWAAARPDDDDEEAF